MKVFPTFAEDRSPQTETLKNVAHETIGETYIEEDPSVAEWFRECVPTSQDAAGYVRELFPSARWIRRYNLHWLAGDAIAGKYQGPECRYFFALISGRYHSRSRRSSPGHGLCITCSTVACIRALHYVHRGLPVLDLRNISRHCNRCKSSPKL